jgi:hypothetical protein
MRETPTKSLQDDIKSIQERIQAFKIRTATSPLSESTQMVEMFPANSAPSPQARESRPTPTPSATTDAPQWQALQQRATEVLKPAPQAVERQAISSPSRPSLNDSLRLLETKAQHINQLSAQQEAAMQELKTLAERLERDWRAMERQQEPFTDDQDLPPLCEYLETLVPFIERNEDGAFVISSRSVDLFRAEREATLMAQNLRTRSVRTVRPAKPAFHWLTLVGNGLAIVRRLIPSAIAPQSRRITRSRSPHRSAPETMSLGQALLWVVGAAIARKLLNLVLISHPGLWLPVTVILVSPALFAAYRATVAPESGMTWLYRLLAVLVGLLIGGRL